MNVRLTKQFGTIVLILAGAISWPALVVAQEEDSDDEQLIEEIVVAGYRGSLLQSVEIKRSSGLIVDAITSEDVGKFPDTNAAESLQRITGVQVNRLRGEGQTINIRGLPSDFTRVQLNGRTLPSALTNVDSLPSRSFDYTGLPSEFIKTLEVYKSSSASMEEGGLAGTVVVRTPRPFDFDGMELSGSVQGGWNSNSDEISPRVSGIFSNIFGDGTWGLTVGGAYFERAPETHELDYRGYNNTLTEDGGTVGTGIPQDFNGNGVIDPGLFVEVPDLIFFNIYPEERARTSGFASLEGRPNDRLKLHFDAYYTDLQVEATRFENLYIPRNAVGPMVPSGTEIVDHNGTPRTGRYESELVDLRGGSRFEDRDGDTVSLAVGGEYSVGLWNIEAEFSNTESSQIRNNLNIADIALGRVAVDAISDPNMISLTHPGGFEDGRLDGDNFRIASLNGEFLRRTDDDLSDFRIDIEREFTDGVISSVEFGGKISARDYFQDNGRLVIGGPAFSALNGGLPASPVFPGGFNAAQFMDIVRPSSGSFLGAYSGNAVFPQFWLGSFTQEWLRGFSNDELLAAGNFTNGAPSIVNVEEDVTAAYVNVNFESSDALITGNFGVRLVTTDQTSSGVAPDLTGIVFEPNAGGVTTVPGAEPVSVSRSYTELLPSFNLKLAPSDSLQFRFAASRTMARPGLFTLSPSTTANGQNGSVSHQNPLLDPFLSNNFDASVEWYMDGGGLFSVTGFYKDIVSLVRLSTVEEIIPITVLFSDGSTTIENRPFRVSRPVNGAGVTVKGFELTYQKHFESLPAPFDGLGMTANYTFIDNSDTDQLTGSSENNFNLTAYYEKESFSARLAYVWRDDFLVDPERGFGDGSVATRGGLLDANLSYAIGDNMTVVLEATNLLDEASASRYHSGVASKFTDSGVTVLFGIRGRFSR